MLKKLKDDFGRGIERVKWFSSVFSDRLKIEITIMKLLYKSDKMEKKKVELLRMIGTRVYELRGHFDKNMLRDRTILEAIGGIEKIEKDMEELRQKVSEIGNVS